jgi:hypothetical protein
MPVPEGETLVFFLEPGLLGPGTHPGHVQGLVKRSQELGLYLTRICILRGSSQFPAAELVSALRRWTECKLLERRCPIAANTSTPPMLGRRPLPNNMVQIPKSALQ